MLEEDFVEIEGFTNYKVSNYGNIVNVHTNRQLNPWPDSNGYLTVTLYDRGMPTKWLVHRLVARAFFVDYSEDCFVLHENKLGWDNAVVNLHIKPFKWKKHLVYIAEN